MDDIKENEHISFDEMIEFFEMNQDNPDNVLFVNRINEHLCTCKECREDYEKIKIFNSAVNNYANFVNKRDVQ